MAETIKATWPKGKTAAEFLRECAADCTSSYPSTTMSIVMTDSCLEEGEKAAFEELACQIEREIEKAKRGTINLPVDENGNPWNLGDEFAVWGCDTTNKITGILYEKDGVMLRDGQFGIEAEYCKRPEPKVLDADGVPINVGDTIYSIYNGSPLVVKKLFENDSEFCGEDSIEIDGFGLRAPAKYLTHKVPDSQEKIDASAQKNYMYYWNCAGEECSECPAKIEDETPHKHYSVHECSQAMMLDLLRRQRELDAKEKINVCFEMKGLQEQVHQTAVDHGWWENTPSFGEVIALINSEAAEALEEYRDGKLPDETYYSGDKPEGIPSELADIVIRVMDYCEYAGIDLEAAILEKDAYNKKRPYRHGGKVL